jgi:hypothetical protein
MDMTTGPHDGPNAMKTTVTTALCALAILGMANAAWADSRLLFAEAQLVAGYDFENLAPYRLQFYSMDQMDVMQKPSVGFDLVQRLSSETGDWGLFAVQARLAYDSTHNGNVEPQLYNAFLKVKPGFGDVWIGHNKPAFGLAMSLDNHGTLLQPLSMQGYGFDRDWGAGYYRDFESGNIAFSATLGSGMGIYARGNYLFSGRISRGDLNQQNYNLGMSASYGKALETMGYQLGMDDPIQQGMVGADFTHYTGPWEDRIEFVWDRTQTDLSNVRRYTLFHRLSLNVLAENRLKFEFQHIWVKRTDALDAVFSLGLSFQFLSDLTGRLVFAKGSEDPAKMSAQIYWYHKI